MSRGSHIDKRFAGRIKNRGICQAGERSVALGAHYSKRSVSLGAAIDQDPAILHDRHSVAEHVPGVGIGVMVLLDRSRSAAP